MKNITSVISLLFLVLFLLVSCDKSSSDEKKEVYQLQEQCKKKSEEFYKKKFNDSGFYQNHYNKKLNKCFLLVDDSEKYGKNLFEVNELKIYGSYSTEKDVFCSVLGKKCKSEQEWDSLVKPYMEE